MSLSQVAKDSDIPPETIQSYLKKIWKEKKYQRFIKQQKSTEEDKRKNLSKFGFKQWMIEHYLYIIVLIVLVFISYANSINNEFVSDDIEGILNNKNIDDISYVTSSPFRLLRFFQPLFYFLINQVFGKSPIAFRLPNILFHLATVCLVFIIIYLLFDKITAIMAASLAAVHPILIESITWISGGGHCMYSFFIMLSILSYILTLKNNRYIYLSLTSFFLALTISEKAIIFPIILFVYELCFENLKTNWKKLLLFLGISSFWGLYFLSSGAMGTRITSLETNFYQKPKTSNLLHQVPIAITSYLELIFWPKNLTLYHSEMVFSQLEYFIKLGVLIAFLGIIVYSFKRNRHIFFWLSFFIISLLPTMTPFGISWLVAERYVYLGSIGIFVVIAIVVKKLNDIKKIRNIPLIIFTLILVALTTRTIVRNRDWKNQDNLWLAAAKTSPSSHQNHNNLGDYYGRHGNFEKAIEEFKKAIELKPGYADAYHNLANIYWQTNKINEAIKNYQKAIEINPNIWQSYQNLAAIYLEQKNFKLAEENLKKFIELQPANEKAKQLLNSLQSAEQPL